MSLVVCVRCACTASVCSAVNTAARQRCRDRLRAVFQATAAIRFFISGMNKSQWERDRLLRSKEMNTAGLPSRQLISLGYGVKGPSDGMQSVELISIQCVLVSDCSPYVSTQKRSVWA